MKNTCLWEMDLAQVQRFGEDLINGVDFNRDRYHVKVQGHDISKDTDEGISVSFEVVRIYTGRPEPIGVVMMFHVFCDSCNTTHTRFNLSTVWRDDGENYAIGLHADPETLDDAVTILIGIKET